MLMVTGRMSNRQQLMGFKTENAVNGWNNRHTIHLYTITEYMLLSNLRRSCRAEMQGKDYYNLASLSALKIYSAVTQSAFGATSL